MSLSPRDNPFRSEQIDSIPFQFLDTNLSEIILTLEQLNFRAEIAGPHGAGKTTLIENIETHLLTKGVPTKHLRMNVNKNNNRTALDFIATTSPEDIIIFDGADLVNNRTWNKIKRATKQYAGLIVTTHDTGLLPTLLTCRTSPALQRKIITELTGDNSKETHTLSNKLYKEHNGNIRDSLRSMYDIWGSK